jgi:hypothetical protein
MEDSNQWAKAINSHHPINNNKTFNNNSRRHNNFQLLCILTLKTISPITKILIITLNSAPMKEPLNKNLHLLMT